ncbi:MAG: hypothetical protein CMF61_03355 [Magnetococcales bacterium]|nr:hypothetical protein [Magnetococcales bacterium]
MRQLTPQEHIMLEIARGNGTFVKDGHRYCAICKANADCDALDVEHAQDCHVLTMRLELGTIWVHHMVQDKAHENG